MGLAGNYYSFNIFLHIEFIVGSIFALLALQFLGLFPGILAGAIIASMTYLKWNHPYSIVIMTSEIAFVGILIRKKKFTMVLADLLFWAILGAPFVYLFYHIVMHVSESETFFIIMKMAINGIGNVLIARLLYIAYALKSHTRHITYNELLINVLGLCVMCPTLILLANSSRSDFLKTDQEIRDVLTRDKNHLSLFIKSWIERRDIAISSLAKDAITKTPAEMQSAFQQLSKYDTHFLSLGLNDRFATNTAYYESSTKGGEGIGTSFADRPYLDALKKLSHPMLTEVLLNKMGSPLPIVAILCPVRNRGNYNGYVFGILSLSELQGELNQVVYGNDDLYTLLDKNKKIILTNRPDQKVMSYLFRPKGKIVTIDFDDDTFDADDNDGIQEWIPDLARNTPAFEEWTNAFYVSESAIGTMAEWSLILEQPVAPFQKKLFDAYTKKMNLLFVILFIALFIAEILSRKLVNTLKMLGNMTSEMPSQLTFDRQMITWPESGIQETSVLIENFKQMSSTLTKQFQETNRLNQNLETRVQERTHELQLSQQHMLLSLQMGRTCSWSYNIQTRQLHSSAEGYHILGLPPVEGDFPREKVEACIPDSEVVVKALIGLVKEGRAFDMEFSVQPADGSELREIHAIAVVAKDPGDNGLQILGFMQDITERKMAEKRLLVLNSGLQEANEKLESFSRSVSHDLRAPLNTINSFTKIILEDFGETLDPKVQDSFSHVLGATQRMDVVLEGLLEISNITRFDLDLESIDLSPMILEIGNELKLLWPNRDIKFVIPPKIIINGDRRLLTIIVSNLLSNACKFTAKKPHAIIEFGAIQNTTNAEKHIYFIRDNGAGFDMRHVHKLFLPFERLHTLSEFGGTGLGLATVHRAIKRHGGKIWAASQINQGATFYFTI